MVESIISTATAIGAAIGASIVTIPLALLFVAPFLTAPMVPVVVNQFLNKQSPRLAWVWIALVMIPYATLICLINLSYGILVVGGIGGLFLAIPSFVIYGLIDAMILYGRNYVASEILDFWSTFRFFDFYLISAAIALFALRKVILELASESIKDMFKTLIEKPN